MSIDPIAKFFVITGILLIAIGIGWQMGWLQNLKLGHLPGDISIEKENFKLYIPLTTGLLVSGLLSLMSWFIRSL